MTATARPAPRHLAVLLLLGALTGCDTGERFPPACPGLALLPDAADLTRYHGAGRDVGDLEADARITAVPATCARGDAGIVMATLNVRMDVTRGPATRAEKIALPYFVAVLDGQRVLDEQDGQVVAGFPGNLDHATAIGDEVTLNLPVTKARSAAAYRILVGFRLTPEELAVNRRRGPR